MFHQNVWTLTFLWYNKKLYYNVDAFIFVYLVLKNKIFILRVTNSNYVMNWNFTKASPSTFEIAHPVSCWNSLFHCLRSAFIYSCRTCFGVCYCTEPGAPVVRKSNISWSLRFSWSGAKVLIRQWPESIGIPELSPRDSSLGTEKEPSAQRVLGQGLHERTPNTWSLVTHQPL